MKTSRQLVPLAFLSLCALRNTARSVCTMFAVAAVPALFHVLIALVGVAWIPVAHASNGQCRWEGGPGTAIYSACKLEDCIEDGGMAICTEPEIRPSTGVNEAQTDGDKFSYGMCDVGGASIPKIARWCAAEGGTWVITGASTQECRNLPPQYPGVGSAANEQAAITASDNWISMGSSCSWGLSGDTGWGLSDPTDQLCWSGSPVYRNGQLLWDIRRRDYTLCGNPAGSIKLLKTRRLACPDETSMRQKPNGDLQCYVPVQACLKLGNPVDCGTGAKTAREVDYRAEDGLEFARFYNSLGRFRIRGSGPYISGGDDYWRLSYQRRLIPISGNSYAMAAVQREDGSVTYFNTAGQEVLNKTGGAERLQSNGGSGWQITLANSDVEYYDAQGRLTSVVTRAGVATMITYDINGRIGAISNTFGRTLTPGYDPNGRLSSLTLPDSHQILYAYDDRGRLSTVTYADSSVKTYVYEDTTNQWLLTGIVDENNSRFATYSYTGGGRVQSEEHAGGVDRYSIAIGSLTQTETSTSVTDPLGQYRQYVIDNTAGVFRLRYSSPYCPTCPNISQASFDANGNYSMKADLNGKQTTYIYDLARNLETSRTEASGTPNARTITTTWDPTFRFPATITEPNRRTSYTYDASGNQLTRTVTDTGATPNASRTWTYTYDSYGRVLTADGPRTDVADVTTYTYYTCYTGNECGRLHTVTNPLGQITIYNTYNADGQPLTITDSNNVVTTLTYDLRQRLILRETGGETTTFEYWPTGQMKKVTQPDGSFLLYTYDGAHRLVQIDDGLGNHISYTLDAAGNRQVENTYDPFGALVRTRTQLYNKLGQLWQVLTAAGTDAQGTLYTYDQYGNQTRVDAPLGRTTTNTYDELERLKQVTNPALGTTAFLYDANDNVTQVTDPRGLQTTYTYNGFGDQKTQTSPDSGLTTNTYDSRGNLATSTDARGGIRTYAYDALDRVTSVTYQIGSTVDQTVTYGYDAGTYGKGRLTSASDANHALSWTYDALGRVASKSQTVNGVTKVVGYSYTNGNLTAIALPSGQVVNYGYNSNRQIVSMTLGGSPATTILNNVLYDAFGPTGGWTWGNGTLAVRVRDLDGRIAQIDSAGFSSYSYNDDGSINTRLDDTPSTYALSAGSTTVAIAASSNRVTATSGVLSRTYAYDAAGNPSGMANVTFTYNGANRMSSVTRAGATTAYAYNALGQRIRKSGPDGTTLFVYDEAGHLLGEYDGTGSLIQETVWLGDIPVATLRPKSGGGVDVFYVHTDQLDAPRRITRPSDNVIVWRWDSDPYGAALPDQDPDGDAAPFVYNLRFPGQQFDAETGLSYNYRRDYDPYTGRYLESDPVGLAAGINTYAYAGGDPADHVDPSGLIHWKGEMYSLLASAPLGGAQFIFDLKSDCVNGKYAYLHVYASALIAGLGAKVTGGGGPIEFDDGYVDIEPDVFDGTFRIFSAGAGAGLTYGWAYVQLGKAISTPDLKPSPSIGFDFSVAAGVGRSQAWGVEIKDCCRNR